MITFDRNTGDALVGWEACAARILEIITTEKGERIKRRDFGVEGVTRLGRNQSKAEAMLVQNDILRALKAQKNGISAEFKANQVSMQRTAGSSRIEIKGTWKGVAVRLEA